jgi:peptide/nickel transport system permease protein
MKYVFSTKLGWFPLYGMISRNHEFYSPFGQTLDVGYHYILPVVVLVFLSIGGLVRYTRTNMLEVLSSDYIRTARAKGVAENKVINYHAFRNTLIPVVTILGGSLPSLFSGAMITETLFQIEGIGYTSYQCMTQGDVPFTMFYLAFMSVLTLVGLLIQDILYAVVDPRVRIS